jgi:hypothetical protein
VSRFEILGAGFGYYLDSGVPDSGAGIGAMPTILSSSFFDFVHSVWVVMFGWCADRKWFFPDVMNTRARARFSNIRMVLLDLMQGWAFCADDDVR